jgi:DNA-binding GntR family transcriptional regulator
MTGQDTETGTETSAPQRVVREIVRGLYEGNYVPGQRLAEPELMEEFGVSRSTARESIRRMEAEGIVDVLPHRGAVIRRLTLKQAIDALLVMEACVGLAARLAAERIAEGGNRARFLAAWADLEGFRDATEGFELVKARNRFYRAITEASDNRELRNYSMGQAARFEDYARMAETILAGEPDAAERAAREHIARTAEVVRRSADG